MIVHISTHTVRDVPARVTFEVLHFDVEGVEVALANPDALTPEAFITAHQAKITAKADALRFERFVRPLAAPDFVVSDGSSETALREVISEMTAGVTLPEDLESRIKKATTIAALRTLLTEIVGYMRTV